MNKISPHLQHSSLLLIVTCFAIGLFLGHPVNASAAGKASPAPAQNELAAGRLVIVRSAALGPTIVGLKIDGKKRPRSPTIAAMMLRWPRARIP